MRMGRRVRMKVSLDQLYSVKLSHVFETARSRRKKVISCFGKIVFTAKLESSTPGI